MAKIVIIAENKAQQAALAQEFGAALERGSTGLQTSGATPAEIAVFNERTMNASSGTPNDMKAQLQAASGSKDTLIITTAGRVSTGFLFSSQPVAEYVQQTYGNSVTVINAAGTDAKTIKAGVESIILAEREPEVAKTHGQISAEAQARYNQALQERQRGGQALMDEKADPGRKGGGVNPR